MNEVLAKIHQVDVKKAGLEDYGKHGKWKTSLILMKNIRGPTM